MRIIFMIMDDDGRYKVIGSAENGFRATEKLEELREKYSRHVCIQAFIELDGILARGA